MNVDDEEELNFSGIFGEKKKRKFTKDDAIYGVFNDGWEDDDEDKLTEEDYYKMKKRYSTPIGFVASGIYEPNANKEVKKDENGDEMKIDDEEKKKKKKEKKDKKEKKQKKNKNGSGGLGYNNNYSDNEESNVEDRKIGGIGAALLSKMGYKGTGGLGREGTGMVEPIKVVVRPKNAGLSSVVEATENLDTSSSESDDSDESDNENKRNLGWKKKEVKAKYDFNEHLDKPKKTTTTTTSSTPQIVIDMRGPQTKLYTGIEEIKHHQNKQHHQHQPIPIEQKPLGELKHNIELLLKLKQIDLQNQDNKIKHEKDKINNLTRGVDKLKLTIENDNEQIKRVNEIKELITDSKKQLDQDVLELKQLYNTFKLLKTQYSREYQNFKLYNLEKELLQPILINKLSNWDIEKDPVNKKLSKEIIKWRSLFDDGSGDSNASQVYGRQQYQNQTQSNIYFILIRDLILPKFKQFLRREWDVKKPVLAATLISSWSECLPEVIQEALLEQSILPKLKVAIDKWDPRKDTVPIDFWLLPWVPFLKAELEPFFPSIRQKIISALQEWYPDDNSALLLLLPWRNVFEGNSMDSLLHRAIIPKLSKLIKDLVINPSNQKPPDEIKWLLQWSNSDNNYFIPQSIIISILEKQFFTRWLTVLLNWLKSPDFDFEEVSNWYSGWKKQFPQEINSNERIKSIFSIALNLMKKLLSNNLIDKNDEDLINQKINSILNSQQPIVSISSPSIPPTLNNNSNSNNNNYIDIDKISTKQMVEQLAINNGLLFVPSQKRTDTGQQIYIFDKIPIIIDKDLIMYNNNNRWEPANIQYLLDKSLNR